MDLLVFTGKLFHPQLPNQTIKSWCEKGKKKTFNGQWQSWYEDHSSDKSISFSVGGLTGTKKEPGLLFHWNSKHKSFLEIGLGLDTWWSGIEGYAFSIHYSFSYSTFSNIIFWILERGVLNSYSATCHSGFVNHLYGGRFMQELSYKQINHFKMLVSSGKSPTLSQIFAIGQKLLVKSPHWAEILGNISVRSCQRRWGGWKRANDWYCGLCHQLSIYGKENSSVRFVGGCQGRY